MTASDPVASAAEAYVRRALDIAQDHCPGPQDKAIEYPPGQWREEPFEHPTLRRFRIVPRVWSAMELCLERELGQLDDDEFPERAAFGSALKADPVIGPRLDSTTAVGGAGLGGSPWQTDQIMRGFVFALLDPAAPSGVAEEAVADTINRRLAWLRRDTEEITVLSPLTAFELDEAPLELDAGLEIVELTSEEIASILMFGPQAVGAFGWRLPSAGSEPAMVARTFAVKSTFSMPIVVDGGTEEQIDAKVKADDEALKNAENVLLALRLFGRTYVALHSSVTLRNDERGMPEAFQSRTSNLAGLLGGPFGSEPYHLTEGAASLFAAFFRQFSVAKAAKVIEGAARRFGYAADRALGDDRIVDLVIAGESLYLAEISPGDRGGEMRYRISQRAALFADGDVEYRRNILRFMRKAYDVRSAIVHSGTFDESNLRGIAGEPATTTQFAAELEHVIREALRKAVRLRAEHRAFPPRWDEMLFPVAASDANPNV